jgi:hypothetical protein
MFIQNDPEQLEPLRSEPENESARKALFLGRRNVSWVTKPHSFHPLQRVGHPQEEIHCFWCSSLNTCALNSHFAAQNAMEPPAYLRSSGTPRLPHGTVGLAPPKTRDSQALGAENHLPDLHKWNLNPYCVNLWTLWPDAIHEESVDHRTKLTGVLFSFSFGSWTWIGPLPWCAFDDLVMVSSDRIGCTTELYTLPTCWHI